jgi:hypothetical protein
VVQLGRTGRTAITGHRRTRQIAQRKDVDSAESRERGESPGVVSSENAAAAGATLGALGGAASICTAASPAMKHAEPQQQRA